MSKKRSLHVGSSLDDFLKQDGILKELQVKAVKEVVAWQREHAINKKRGVSKDSPAKTLQTSRTKGSA